MFYYLGQTQKTYTHKRGGIHVPPKMMSFPKSYSLNNHFWANCHISVWGKTINIGAFFEQENSVREKVKLTLFICSCPQLYHPLLCLLFKSKASVWKHAS